GNVRELRNAIERAVVIARGEQITVADLPERVRWVPAAPGTAAPPEPEPEPTPAPGSPVARRDTAKRLDGDYKSRLHRFERELILETLESVGWSRSAAARRLEMPVRTLSHRMQKLDIEREGDR
ncbi:MAG: helix-turn-helix domain-containing protein, partial [Anaerolineae bacterium]